MSYSCYISFKKIPAEDVNSFFSNLKQLVKQTYMKIADAEFYYCPAYKDGMEAVAVTVPYGRYSKRAQQEDWARKTFTYRWFYLAKEQTLGVFGVSTEMRVAFDTTIYFQNSCDQDYDFEAWKELKFLAPIVEKCKALTPQQINEIRGDDDLEYYEETLDYYRRSLCYKEIWDTYFDDKLYDEGKAVYISLFSPYYDDLCFIDAFARKCYELTVEEHLKWLNENL